MSEDSVGNASRRLMGQMDLNDLGKLQAWMKLQARRGIMAFPGRDVDGQGSEFKAITQERI